MSLARLKSTILGNWMPVVRDKWLIFDSDAVISIIEYDQKILFDALRGLRVKFLYINPVLLELMNTNSAKEKLARSALLLKYEFTEIPLHQIEIKLAGQIQKSLPLQCQPSPTDLYLGGTLARHNNEDRLLITANIKDFPLPLYTRKAHILLSNDRSIKPLSILSLDQSLLVDAT